MSKKTVNKNTGEIFSDLEKIEQPAAVIPRDFSVVRAPYFRHSVLFQNVDPIGNKPMVSRTHKSHASTCDINNIIRQFDRTGVLPPAAHTAQYADVSALNADLTQLINDEADITERYRLALLELRDRKSAEVAAQAKADFESAVQLEVSRRSLPSSTPQSTPTVTGS